MRNSKSIDFIKNVQKIRQLRYEKNSKTRDKLKEIQELDLLKKNSVYSSYSSSKSNNNSFSLHDDDLVIDAVDPDKLFDELDKM